MYKKAPSGRDAFEFSLRGMTTIASFGPVPVIADDKINKVIDQTLARAEPADQPTMTREIENFLARLFAPPGLDRAA
ncbi:MAG: hypothetical protein AAF660_11095 [Pseudomonadota bacterium]